MSLEQRAEGAEALEADGEADGGDVVAGRPQQIARDRLSRPACLSGAAPDAARLELSHERNASIRRAG